MDTTHSIQNPKLQTLTSQGKPPPENKGALSFNRTLLKGQGHVSTKETENQGDPRQIKKYLIKVNEFIEKIKEKINLKYYNFNRCSDNNLSLDYSHIKLINEVKTGDKELDFVLYKICTNLKLVFDKADSMLSRLGKLRPVEGKAQEIGEDSVLKEEEPDIEQIIQNFNRSSQIIESNLKELKSPFSQNPLITTNQETINVEKNILTNHGTNNSNNQTNLRNEIHRLEYENASLKLEMNFLLVELEKNNKIHILKSQKDNENLIALPAPNGVEEIYLIAKNYIKSLMKTEFYFN